MSIVSMEIQPVKVDVSSDKTSGKTTSKDGKKSSTDFQTLMNSKSSADSKDKKVEAVSDKITSSDAGKKSDTVKEPQSAEVSDEIVALLNNLKSLISQLIEAKPEATQNTEGKITEVKSDDKKDLQELLVYVTKLLDKGSKTSEKVNTKTISSKLQEFITKNINLTPKADSQTLKTDTKADVKQTTSTSEEAKLLSSILGKALMDKEDVSKSQVINSISQLNNKTDEVKSEVKLPISEIKDLVDKIASLGAKLNSSDVKNGDVDNIKKIISTMVEVSKEVDVTKDTKVVNEATTLTKSQPETKTIEGFAKPQTSALETNLQNSDAGTKKESNENKDSDSKTTSVEDKLLKKITTSSDNSGSQSFSNLISRVTIQSEATPVQNAEKPVLNKVTFANDVIKTVKFMETNDLKDLTVKINPRELGEVVIKIVQEGNNMKATITASNKEAFQVINSNLQDINSKISQSNTNIQSFSVDVFNGEGSFMNQNSKQGQESNKNRTRNSLLMDDETTINDSVLNEDSNVNVLV